MKSVTFRVVNLTWPSSRLRAAIPQRALADVGVRQGRDVLVIGKHGWDWDVETCGYKRIVYDVCDSHWSDRWRDEVIDYCGRADAVTCNSHVMADEIKAHTGRDAWIIPDPYEAPEGEPRINERLLWFGWHWNAQALQPWAPKLVGRDVTILIDNVDAHELAPGVRVVPWSPEAMDAEFERAGLVILPTDMRPKAKSGNRAIESIRRGVFPICGPLPAYADLGVYIGDIDRGVDWALANRGEVLKRIRAAQEYVRAEYNPARIGRLWRAMLDTL